MKPQHDNTERGTKIIMTNHTDICNKDMMADKKEQQTCKVMPETEKH